jgi:hypothetical protein
MANNKKITELPRAVPNADFNFVAATENDNFKVTFNDLKEVLIPDDIGSSEDIEKLARDLAATGDHLHDHIDLIMDEDGNIRDGFIAKLAPKFPDSFVFFTDVVNNNGPCFYEYYLTPTRDTFLSGVYVESASDLKVSIRWDGPLDEYIGTGFINGVDVPFENIHELGDKTRRFEGFIDHLNLSSTSLDRPVKSNAVGYANGFTGYLSVVELGPGALAHDISISPLLTATPAPESLLGTQHLKEGDTINVNVIYKVDEFQYDLQIPKRIEVKDEGLAKPGSFSNLSWQASPLGVNYSGFSFPIVVSEREGDLGVCLETVNFAGITGAKQCSLDFPGANRSRPVDNTGVLISFQDVDYPAVQGAIKDGETAVVNHVIDHADAFEYTSEIGELTIANNSSYETSKSVSYLAGGYNIDSPNFNVKAIRTTNGIISKASTIVKIANSPLSLTINNLPSALQSGPTPNGKEYVFTSNSDQLFGSQKPLLMQDSTQNPASLFFNQTEDEDSFDSKLVVTDGDEKGVFSWSVSAFNLANVKTTSINPPTYNIQGFTERTIEAHPQDLAAGLAPLGVSVGNPSNINFENLSKGGSGRNGGTNFSYLALADGVQLDFSFNEPNKFTVCDSSGVVNSNGDHVFNLDSVSRAANADVNNPARFVVSED